MKKIILFLICLSISLSVIGCKVPESTSSAPESSTTTEETSITESSEISETSVPINEIFKFLDSKYTVSARRQSYGNIYTYEYYFENGLVTGAKQKITFESTDDAEEYLQTVQKKFPHAFASGLSVTLYLSDDDDFYYGYSLEKLKFTLDNVGYVVTVNFDEKAFYEEFPPEKPS